MLIHAVVVAGDGARAYVNAFANLRVAQIRQMIRLRPLAQLDLLGLNKISHVSAFANFASRTQIRIRPRMAPAPTRDSSMIVPA